MAVRADAIEKNWATFEMKAKLPVAEADALDWKAFNNQHLRVARMKSFNTYGGRRFYDATVYDGTSVFAVEAMDYRMSLLASEVSEVFNSIYFDGIEPNYKELAEVSVQPAGYIVKTGNGGGRDFQFCFAQAFGSPPRGQVCNPQGFGWPRGVGTVGISRTLPELLEDSQHYFTHAGSLVQFCLGLKVFEPTKQMVAFMRKRIAPGAANTHLSWAASFGTQPLDESSVRVLQEAGVEELVNEACQEPGVAQLRLVIPRELIFYMLPPTAFGSTAMGDMPANQQVEVDLYSVQQACLVGLAAPRRF